MEGAQSHVWQNMCGIKQEDIMRADSGPCYDVTL